MSPADLLRAVADHFDRAETEASWPDHSMVIRPLMLLCPNGEPFPFSDYREASLYRIVPEGTIYSVPVDIVLKDILKSISAAPAHDLN